MYVYIYIIYVYIIYHFYILYIIIIDSKTSWLPMARRTGPYRPVPLPWPTPSLQGLRQHFHVAVLELVALVDRHTDAWWDRKPLGRCGRWSERDVLKNN